MDIIEETTKINTPRDITNLRQDIRGTQGSVVTNFNSFPSETEKWIDEHRIRLLVVTKEQYESKWLIHEMKNSNEVYFFARDYKSVENDIDIISSVLSSTSIIEVITKDSIPPINKIPIMVLRRMSSTTIPQPTEKKQTVQYANAIDTLEIETILMSSFNPIAERIPSRDELLDYINYPQNGGILIIKKDEGIIGILIYSINATTIHLRHFWTDENHRGSGIGSVLMNEYFREASKCQRMILWVKTDNENAIGVYRHYGFKEENLYDYIYQIK